MVSRHDNQSRQPRFPDVLDSPPTPAGVGSTAPSWSPPQLHKVAWDNSTSVKVWVSDVYVPSADNLGAVSVQSGAATQPRPVVPDISDQVSAEFGLLFRRNQEMLARLDRLEQRLSSAVPSQWFVEHLFELLALENGWDDEGGERITPAAAKVALRVAAATADVTAEPEPIPISSGGVELYWAWPGSRWASLSISKDGELGDLLSLEGSHQVTERPVSNSREVHDALRNAFQLDN